jgi:hypothetical protein
MKVDKKYLIGSILEVLNESPYRRPSIERNDISDRLQRSEMQRYLKIARTQGRTDIVEALKELIEALDNFQLPEDEYETYMAAIKDELDQPEKKREPRRTSCRKQPIKEALAEIQFAAQKVGEKELQKRVGVTVRDEIGLFGWGAILKFLSSIGLASLGLPGGAAAVEFVDFVWNASPRIMEDLLTRPEASWGKQNIIDQFPVLDKLNIDEKIYKLIAPEAIGIIAKNYIAEIEAMVDEDPNACVEDMPDVDDYYVDWLKANPEFNQLMKRGGKRKYRRSFTLNESDNEFQKLMDLANDKNAGSGIQALEMYEFFDLTERQIKALYNVVLYTALENNVEDLPEVLEMRPEEFTEQEIAVHRDMAYKKIIFNAEEPGELLLQLGYDLHKEFTEVYGITPPRDQQFIFDGNDTKLEVPLPGNKKLIFSFWFEGNNEDHPSDPWILAGPQPFSDNEFASIESPRSGLITMEISTPRGSMVRGDGYISKEEVPAMIKRFSGWPESDSINEKVDRNYLFRMINEVLREDEDDDMDIEKKIDDFIASEDLDSFNTGLSLLDTFEMSGLIEPEKAKELKFRMYDTIDYGNLFLDDVNALYGFITSDDFASSFSDKELKEMKTKIFNKIVKKYGSDPEKVVKMILGKDMSNLNVDGFGGDPFSGIVEITGFGGQEEADNIIEKFRDFSENDNYAALFTADEPMILVGDRAFNAANFNKIAQDLFAYKPKQIPYVTTSANDLATDEGEGNPYKVEYSPLLEKGPVEFSITTKNTLEGDWKLIITFNEGWDGYLQVDYKRRLSKYLIRLNQHDERYTNGKSLSAWLIDSDGEIQKFSKDQMLAKVKEISGIDLNDVGPSHYERDQMKESVPEIEENFGRESRGDEVLQEGWEDQWPSEFGFLLRRIKGSINSKSDKFNEALVKIFYRMGKDDYIMPIKWIRGTAYSIKRHAESGMKNHSNKIASHSKWIADIKAAPTEDFPQEEKDEQIAEWEGKIKQELKILNQYTALSELADNDFYFGKGRRKEVLKQAKSIQAANPNDKLPAMRYSNKVAKSIKKQLNKWRDKNATFPRVMVAVDAVLQDLPRTIESGSNWAYDKTFEDDLAVLVEFIKRLRGNQEDLGKKLMSLIDNNKNLPSEEFNTKVAEFIDENRQNEFIECKDTEEDVPCVFLKLNDGMFWHRTSVDYCEITQTKMSNCGAASDPTGMLYNLMSNEGGTIKYYITLEYSKSKKKVIQVLGKANTMPKEKYWPAIRSFFEAMGNPLLSKDAFIHMYGDEDEGIEAKEEIDKKIAEFVEGIGARMIPPPAIDSWKSMREQIRGGYYSDTVEKQPFEGRLTNIFRAALLHGKDDGNKTTMMLDIKMVIQTISNKLYAITPLTALNDLLIQDRKKLEEYAKSGELKKEILDFAVPEKYLDSQREIHLKYSRSSDVRASMRTNGAIVIQVSFIFGVRTEPWTEARGEYLVENFNQLIKYTADKLERAGLSMVFAVAPERAAEVYPEEAKRLADVDDILNDIPLEEGKRKQKLDRNYLTSMILEVLNENNTKPYHDLMFDFANPENIIHGVYMFAISELEIFVDGKHQFEGIVHDPFAGGVIDQDHGQDEYIFKVESKQEALRLQEALRDFYKPVQRKVFEEIYISADWYDGPPRVMMDIPK